MGNTNKIIINYKEHLHLPYNSSQSAFSQSLIFRFPFCIYRSVEFVALIGVSCTLFLFLHTQSLTTRLREMEDKLQPSMSAGGLISGIANNLIQGNFLSFTHYGIIQRLQVHRSDLSFSISNV